MKLATVKLLSLPLHIDNGYDYIADDGVLIGAFVSVPFGAGNKVSLGVVTDIHICDEPLTPYKSIDYVYGGEYSLPEGFLELADYVCRMTLCSFGDAVRAVFPVAILGTVYECYKVTDKTPDSLNMRAQAVYAHIAENPGVSRQELISSLGESVREAVGYLCREGYLCRYSTQKENTNIAYDEFYSASQADYKSKSAKMTAAYRYLSDNGETDKYTLFEKTGVNSSQLRTMCGAGAVLCRRVEKYRKPYVAAKPAESPKLTDEQTAAKDGIIELIKSGIPAAALLYGVTGSGKTLVIKAVCDEVIASGKTVIMLVPEIALTPQSVRVFSSFYGERIAVLHSSLSEGEKLDAWKRIRRGQVDMVIGTRSASFAPVKNLGLFVIDEEQEHTYKSDSTPKYHARDIARFRCGKENAVMLLSSATPSVESFYRAESKKYKLIRLASRYSDKGLPSVIRADMREDFAEGHTGPVGTVLYEALRETLEKGEQSILFLNRRGYNSYLSCKMCGVALMCPNCDIALTFHKNKNSENGYLMCHYCGFRTKKPEQCPECGSPHLSYMGYGTQKIDEEISKLLPGARVLVMDADTTSVKSAYDRILSDFRAHKADILLGTQMVTKGHDFPDVTLVGVIMADNSLYLDDYHAQERTFSLLTQVIGRAGRADKPGRAVIQTFNPEHEVMELASKQDYDGFYKGEILMRKALSFPPFCDIALITFQSDDASLITKASAEFRGGLISALNENKDIQMLVYGPVEMKIFKINGISRMQLLCKFRSTNKSRALLLSLLKAYTAKYPRKMSVGIDINPSQL